MAWQSLTKVILLGVILISLGESIEIRCPVIADNTISYYKGQRNLNRGASEYLKAKSYEEYIILNFDFSQAKGLTIKEAKLFLKPKGKNTLKEVTVSTISSPWAEGKGSDAVSRGGSCYNYSTYPSEYWAGKGSSFLFVVFARGSSRSITISANKEADDWLSIPIDPGLIHDLIINQQFGLALADERSQKIEIEFYSKESSHPPYLLLTGEKIDNTPPGKVSQFKAELGKKEGSVKLSWLASGDDGNTGQAQRYEVRYFTQEEKSWEEASSVNPWQVPLPERASTPQEMTLEGLEVGVKYTFGIRVIDEAGNFSDWEKVSLKITSKVPHPIVVEMENYNPSEIKFPLGEKETPLPSNSHLRVWVLDDCRKVNPVSGEVYDFYEEGEEYRQVNSIWNASQKTIYLKAARNEFVAFQLILEKRKRRVKDISIEVSFLKGPGVIPKENIELFKAWYFQTGNAWYPDALIPFTSPLTLPERKNNILGQKNQTIWIDIYIPHQTPPGEYQGRLTINAAGTTSPIVLNLSLSIWNFTLSDKENFIISLNGYEAISKANGVKRGSPEFFDWELKYYRLAHKHRATINNLPYFRDGKLKKSFEVKLKGKGKEIRVSDWSTWDSHFGKYLDGSAFSDLPRAGVPISHLYLPFNEAWPSNIWEHFKEKDSLEASIDEVFRVENIKICQEFVKHFKEKGWLETSFQVYLNNHLQLGKADFTNIRFDGPKYRSDYLGLRYFAQIYKEGFRNAFPVKVVFRADIAQSELMRTYLDGLLGLNVLGSGFTRCPKFHRWRKERLGERCWNYGSPNRIICSNFNSRLWCWETWLLHGDGVMPWNFTGKSNYQAWEKPDNDCLIYPGAPRGLTEPVASMRLKALRRGAQDMEYLYLLEEKYGVDRGSLVEALQKMLFLKGRQELRSEEALEEMQFENLRPEDLEKIRIFIGEMLQKIY
jgi:hypothetical protein